MAHLVITRIPNAACFSLVVNLGEGWGRAARTHPHVRLWTVTIQEPGLGGDG